MATALQFAPMFAALNQSPAVTPDAYSSAAVRAYAFAGAPVKLTESPAELTLPAYPLPPPEPVSTSSALRLAAEVAPMMRETGATSEKVEHSGGESREKRRSSATETAIGYVTPAMRAVS